MDKASALRLGLVLTAGSFLWSAPAGVLMAQNGGRIESDAARTAAPPVPVLPVRPSSARAAAGKNASPPPAKAPATTNLSELQDPNRPGLTGLVLGMRIDTTISYLGLNRCGARIKQVMLALTDNRPAAYYFEPTGRNASQSPLLITLESLSGDSQAEGSRYSILTINPDCSGFYTQTVSWPLACEEVARTSFPNFRFDRRVVANVDSYRASPLLQMSTMKTPGGCVSVKKEIFK
jgi:hypothetical protein